VVYSVKLAVACCGMLLGPCTLLAPKKVSGCHQSVTRVREGVSST
jgi:hypothetical protein